MRAVTSIEDDPQKIVQAIKEGSSYDLFLILSFGEEMKEVKEGVEVKKRVGALHNNVCFSANSAESCTVRYLHTFVYINQAHCGTSVSVSVIFLYLVLFHV